MKIDYELDLVCPAAHINAVCAVLCCMFEK